MEAGVRVVAVVALGGVLGAAARYGLELTWPPALGTFPWVTLAVNVLGCALIGVLMAHVDRGGTHPLLRPFLGTGVLGGFTTFSTYAVQSVALADAGRPAVAGAYVLLTLVAALAAVVLGGLLGRAVLPRRPS